MLRNKEAKFFINRDKKRLKPKPYNNHKIFLVVKIVEVSTVGLPILISGMIYEGSDCIITGFWLINSKLMKGITIENTKANNNINRLIWCIFSLAKTRL